jgi:hypothetical protein
MAAKTTEIRDLANIVTVERTVEILHPATGEEIGVSYTLMSVNDERVKKARRAYLDTMNKINSRKNPRSEDMEDAKKNFIFACSLGWNWHDGAVFQGEVPTFNRLNVFKVFEKLEWFVAQLDNELGDDTSFFQK